MAKDSYWFRHDSTAGRGLKMRKMAHIYSHWGKGVYWDVVEILRDQNQYQFECDESSLQLLCDLVGCKDEKRFLNWFKDCVSIGLFEIDENFFYCPPLNKNMVKWESTKANGSKGGRNKKSETKAKHKPNLKPTVKPNETIIEQNNIEHNNKSDDVDFISFKDQISKQQQWSETWYMQHQLKKGSLSKLLDEFILSLKLKDYPEQPKDLKNFKSHFVNWTNKQSQIGKLAEHAKYKSKQNGAL